MSKNLIRVNRVSDPLNNKIFSFFSRHSAVANLTSTSNDPSIFKAHVLFEALKTAMEDDKDNLIERVRGIYCFKVKNGPGGKEGMWIINAKDGKGSVEYNGKRKFESVSCAYFIYEIANKFFNL